MEKHTDKEFDKKNAQANQQIFHNLMEIVELYPDKTPSQHFVLLLRSRGKKQPYDWNNEELLKRVEQYKRELEEDPDEE